MRASAVTVSDENGCTGGVRGTVRHWRVRVKTRTLVNAMVGRFAVVLAAIWKCCLYVFARVLYTRYCAMELSTRIFAVIQRLARAVHILAHRLRAVNENRGCGTRSPHWKRVAIKRHEFHPKSGLAVARPRFAGGTGSVLAMPSSSPAATVRLVVAPTSSVQRLAPSGAPHDRSAKFASSGCLAFSSALSACGGSSHLLPEPRRARATTCTRLFEAV